MSTIAKIEPVYRRIGRRIERARVAIGLSQSDLAFMVGHTRVSMSNIESGTQRIQIHTLIAVARALKADVSSFMDPE